MAPRFSKEFRYQLLVRDNFRCRFCNKGGKTSDYILEIHHIVWKRNGGSDHPNNLMVCCARCHDILHYGKETGRPYTFTELKNRQGGV